jgi:hypothetical protein
MTDQRKEIDESWKDAVDKEKANLKKEGKFVPPEADFKFFVTTLALQASIFLGVMEDPVSHKKEENLPQAKFIVDTLAMLKDKTKGNLDAPEADMLENVLYELRLHYIQKTQGGQK